MGLPKEIGMFESKTRLSEIIQRVLGGERFYITRRGKRVAELRPVVEERRPLSRGCAKNPDYWMAEDFDAPLDDLGDYM
jgi:antitoxin (DNA-binding transcriptional repressor) of toxin-antitoxin stability system